MTNYYKKYYIMKAKQTNDSLKLHKTTNSDWCELSMTTNGFSNGQITIRSKEMVEQLHFMLGQLLS